MHAGPGAEAGGVILIWADGQSRRLRPPSVSQWLVCIRQITAPYAREALCRPRLLPGTVCTIPRQLARRARPHIVQPRLCATPVRESHPCSQPANGLVGLLVRRVGRVLKASSDAWAMIGNRVLRVPSGIL